MDNLDDLLLNMLKNKSAVLANMMEDFDQIQKISSGFSEINQNHNLTLDMKVTLMNSLCNSMAAIMSRLIITTMIYIQGDDYEGDIAKFLHKFGRGKEAFHEIFRQKTGR